MLLLLLDHHYLDSGILFLFTFFDDETSCLGEIVFLLLETLTSVLLLL